MLLENKKQTMGNFFGGTQLLENKRQVLHLQAYMHR